MKKLIIIWAWEQWKVIKNIFSYNKNIKFHWFLDDNILLKNVLWKIETFNEYLNKYYFFIAFWENSLRKKLYNKLQWKNANFLNAIHPKAYIENDVTLWENIMIWANTYINIDSKIWNNSIINNWVIIEHDNLIWNHCHIAPWVITAWWVHIWNDVFIWIWSNIINHQIICSNTLIWSWSNVIKSIKSPGTYIWNPTKKLIKE